MTIRRGELYLVKSPSGDPRRQRVVVVVSRQALCDGQHSTLICATVYSRRLGVASEVHVGEREGLKRDSSIHCDDLRSFPRVSLTNYVGSLSTTKVAELDQALRVALDLD